MTEDNRGAAEARRKLGTRLAALREAKGISVDDAAAHIERARPTLWKIESGQLGVRIKPQTDVGRLCDLYEVDQETRDELLALVEVTRVKGWFQPFTDVIRPKFDMYLSLEEVASEIVGYELDLVPGLLQTEDYARAVLSVPNHGRPRDEDEVAKRVELRMRRQNILTRVGAPRVNILLEEGVLRHPIGSDAIMADQLRHINELGELPNLAVRILPDSAGLHHGLLSGKFQMLRFTHDQTVVYVDGFIGALWFKEPKELAKYEHTVTEIESIALDEKKSRTRIEQSVKELSP